MSRRSRSAWLSSPTSSSFPPGAARVEQVAAVRVTTNGNWLARQARGCGPRERDRVADDGTDRS